MRWTERQRQLLGAMGLRLWVPETAAGPAEPKDHPALEAPPTRTSAAVAAPSPVPGPAPTPVPMRAPTNPVAAVAVPPVSREVPDTRAQEILALAWAPLQQAVRDCRACELCEGRQQTVFGVGHPNARWMIVGEAPGEQEDRQGEPFVGAAGHLLDQMLAALRLSRHDGPPERQVFIANAIKCRPPRNRNPTPAEMAYCAPFLARQIALVRPRVILAMGRFAIQQVLGTDEAVGRLRGRVHRHGEVPVVATYHPAYLLRQAVDKRKAWEDLCLAAQVVDNPGGTH
jgi:uracil-DNA glycosylase